MIIDDDFGGTTSASVASLALLRAVLGFGNRAIAQFCCTIAALLVDFHAAFVQFSTNFAAVNYISHHRGFFRSCVFGK